MYVFLSILTVGGLIDMEENLHLIVFVLGEKSSFVY